MESYRHDIKDSYCAVMFMNNKTGKLGLVYNIMYTEQYIRDWNSLPVGYNTSSQRCKKFDFFKYVLGADLSDKYRDKANISEVCDV